MIIKTLELINFQSHTHTTLNFHPNFNCLVGVGNSGKTSIIRALSLLLYGQWDSSWVQHGHNFCRVSLTTDTDIQVIREKGTSVNRYIVKSPGIPDQTYENFGVQVPSEVSLILQIFKVQLDATETINLNLASQMDPLFLLTKSGSVKAKIFGKLTGSHLLDAVLKQINNDKKNLSSEKKVKSDDVVNLKEQLKQYSNIGELKIQLDNIGLQIQQTTKTQATLERVKTLQSRIHDWKKQYNIECDNEAKLCGFDVENLDELTSKVNLLSKIKTLQTKMYRADSDVILKRTEEVNITKLLNSKVQEYVTLIKNNNVCPTCYNSVSNECITKIETTLI